MPQEPRTTPRLPKGAARTESTTTGSQPVAPTVQSEYSTDDVGTAACDLSSAEETNDVSSVVGTGAIGRQHSSVRTASVTASSM